MRRRSRPARDRYATTTPPYLPAVTPSMASRNVGPLRVGPLGVKVRREHHDLVAALLGPGGDLGRLLVGRMETALGPAPDVADPGRIRKWKTHVVDNNLTITRSARLPTRTRMKPNGRALAASQAYAAGGPRSSSVA